MVSWRSAVTRLLSIISATNSLMFFIFFLLGIASATLQFGPNAFKKGTTLCEECCLTVNEFKIQFLENKQVESKLLDFLHKDVCTLISVYKSECDTFIDWFIPDILAELDSYCSNAHQVCSDIGLCKRKFKKVLKAASLKKLFEKSYRRAAKNMRLMNDLACDECRLAIYEFKRRVLLDKEMQKQIGDFVAQNFCPHFAKRWSDCPNFMAIFIPSLFEEISGAIRDTELLCGDIGFCPRVNSF